MATFVEKFKELKEGNSGRKTFSSAGFNSLATSIMNTPDHEVVVAKTVHGEFTEKTTTPVADLRKSLIGGIADKAGMDSADKQRLIDEYQFSNSTPWYPVMSEMLEQYMNTGAAFTFQSKGDMKASMHIEQKQPEVKEVKSPMTGEVSRKSYPAYRKVKVSSNCPNHLKKTLDK